jgi:2-methylcitrate dehydratase
MDSTLRQLAGYASSLRYEDLPDEVIHACKRHLIDTLGCGLGALDTEPSIISRRMALRAGNVPGGASVLGSDQTTLPELAAFANGVMMRYLDGNDTYPGGGGHPSDCIAALLAIAESAKADGRAVILAMTIAYEIHHNLYKVTPGSGIRDKGWDHVLFVALSSAAGAASLLGLDVDRTMHALSLALTPNMALEATRRGHLSMWKGCAAGNAVRNGVFAALLAAEGMTGPDKPIEGPHGLWEIIGEFRLNPLARQPQRFGLLEACIKCFASEYHSQSPITVAMDLSRKVAAGDIASVAIDSYKFAISEIASEREKWHPTTRETADHSMPYIVAAVLLDGAFSDAIFSEARLKDAAIHALADKITISEDPAFTRDIPERIPCRIVITTRDGRCIESSVNHPRGHCRNPMSDAEIEQKFVMHAKRAMAEAGIAPLLARLWKFDTEKDFRGLFSRLNTGK